MGGPRYHAVDRKASPRHPRDTDHGSQCPRCRSPRRTGADQRQRRTHEPLTCRDSSGEPVHPIQSHSRHSAGGDSDRRTVAGRTLRHCACQQRLWRPKSNVRSRGHPIQGIGPLDSEQGPTFVARPCLEHSQVPVASYPSRHPHPYVQSARMTVRPDRAPVARRGPCSPSIDFSAPCP